MYGQAPLVLRHIDRGRGEDPDEDDLAFTNQHYGESGGAEAAVDPADFGVHHVNMERNQLRDSLNQTAWLASLPESNWWLALLLPLPGLLGWLVVQPAPRLLSKANAPKVTPQVYRFLYSAPPEWNDQRARLGYDRTEFRNDHPALTLGMLQSGAHRNQLAA